MNKKTKSNHIHHVGALAQQLLEHAEAIKRNGVAIQWIMHKKLAVAPIKSDFCFNWIIIFVELFATTLFKFISTSTRTRAVSTYFRLRTHVWYCWVTTTRWICTTSLLIVKIVLNQMIITCHCFFKILANKCNEQ